MSRRRMPYKRGFSEELFNNMGGRGPNNNVLMGHSTRAKHLSKMLKKVGFDGNFDKYWWSTYNLSQNTCGCSICNEHVEIVKPDPVVQCRLRIAEAASKFREHENSASHIGVLKKLGMPLSTKRKASECLKPRKRRKVNKQIRSGTCLRCGYYGELQISLQEMVGSKELSHSITFGKFADQILYDHLAQECGPKLQDDQVEAQLNKFRVANYNIYDLITMFNDRPPVVWEGIGIDIRAEQALTSTFMSPTDHPLQMPEVNAAKELPPENLEMKESSEGTDSDRKNEKPPPETYETATPDRRWLWKAIFHVGLQTEWCVQHIWSKEEFQKELRRMWENDPSTPAPGSLVIMEKEILSCAHRLLIEHTFGEKLEGDWAVFYELAMNQAKNWITSVLPLENWIGHSVSVWWSSTSKWNRGRVTGVNPELNEINVDYGDDYDETLRLSETTLRFFNSAPDNWWLDEKLDVKWDGEHEWYAASVDSIAEHSENKIVVQYADGSKEDISIDSFCFYFIQDRVDRVHEFISHLCNAILNKHPLPIMYRKDPNVVGELAQMGPREQYPS